MWTSYAQRDPRVAGSLDYSAYWDKVDLVLDVTDGVLTVLGLETGLVRQHRTAFDRRDMLINRGRCYSYGETGGAGELVFTLRLEDLHLDPLAERNRDIVNMLSWLSHDERLALAYKWRTSEAWARNKEREVK